MTEHLVLSDLKLCRNCDETLPVDSFALNRAARDGRQNFCRSCRRDLYAGLNYKLGKTCVDCGKAVVNHSQGRCRICNPISKRGTGGKDRGRTVNAYGYVLLNGHWDHPNHNNRGQVIEHVLVMSRVLGRPLIPGENVHHINGVRDDNRPENLELWSTSQPSGQRVTDKVAWAKELLAIYEPEALAPATDPAA